MEDDVWVVITLLAFGSLLFCLCCYKVSNLLYMLYHIDDSTESLTDRGTGGAGAGPVVDAAAAHAITQLTNGTTVTTSAGVGANVNNAGHGGPVPISLALEAAGRGCGTGNAAAAAAQSPTKLHRQASVSNQNFQGVGGKLVFNLFLFF